MFWVTCEGNYMTLMCTNISSFSSKKKYLWEAFFNKRLLDTYFKNNHKHDILVFQFTHAENSPIFFDRMNKNLIFQYSSIEWINNWAHCTRARPSNKM